MAYKDKRYVAVKKFWGGVECSVCKKRYSKANYKKGGYKMNPMPMWLCSEKCHSEMLRRVY